MTDGGQVLGVLGRLDALGVVLSLDDFGAGRSSLAHLRRLPLRELKLDRAFVQGMATDPDDRVLVGAVVQLARALGLRVVAEGVESAASWKELALAGCHAAQGFHLAQPLPAPELERWLGGAQPATLAA